LDQVPDPSGMVHLVPATSTKSGLPAVNVSDVTLPGGAAADMPIKAAFEDWLGANIGSFTQVFQSVDLSKAASATPELAWITPKGFNYAVVDGVNLAGTKVSAMAILTQTASNTTPTGMNNLAAQVPAGLLTGMPGNCNALVAISAEQFVANVLLQGAIQMFKGSTAADFVITGNGHTIKNLTPQELPEQTLDSGDKITPKIPKGGMTLSISERKITVAFDGVTGDLLNASSTITGLMVTFGFSQSFFLHLVPRADGKHVLAVTGADPDIKGSVDAVTVDNLVTQVQMTPSARATQEAMLSVGIVLAVLSIGLVTFGAKGLSFVRQVDQQAAATGVAGANAGAAGNVVYGVLPADPVAGPMARVLQSAAQSITGVTGAAVSGGPVMVCMARMSTGLAVAGAIGLISGAGLTTVSSLMRTDAVNFANGDYDKVDAAFTAQELVNGILANFVWPEGKTFQLVSARLDDALMLYGNLV